MDAKSSCLSPMAEVPFPPNSPSGRPYSAQSSPAASIISSIIRYPFTRHLAITGQVRVLPLRDANANTNALIHHLGRCFVFFNSTPILRLVAASLAQHLLPRHLALAIAIAYISPSGPALAVQ